MPNWCDCTLEITGDAEAVRLCLASIASPGSEVDDERLFDFDRVIPLPPDLLTRLETPDGVPEGGFSTLGEVIALWGTKWNAYDVTVDRQPDGSGARMTFCTAWSPPLPVIKTLADRFPNLGFDIAYYDISAPYAGRARRAAGDDHWASIEANYDRGFCRAAFEARSGESWEQDSDAYRPAASLEVPAQVAATVNHGGLA